ncbi:dicarboxylate/amino acid:cation symporter [Sphingopyxis panaciterrulae]|uniref:DAACS family dicarboxylate/amino acid:cation (Na+ or H+) symporter n=1 Tax=Sphingopyxis panaciterrulae TaxID=462372 RepID=A0A7W9ESV3_9SPHN|nr:dicarboxylate/amino acid:cation symporter [Sphingopyxis panaciterrulae]MBB5707550.1 DAACS family dicarboxylate/amino acid:cation (Na+ or H+) symporter [Sphingopyxis panaciterrulae]
MAEASMVAPAGGEEARARRLQWRMLIGFVAGLFAGLAVYYGAADAPWVDTVTTYVTGPIGQIFLRLLFMLVIPLLVSALIVGVAEMGEMRALKTVGLRTLVYTVVVSSIAVAVSLAVVNALQPGAGVDPALAKTLLAEGAARAGSIIQSAHESKSGVEAVVAIVPNNFFNAMSQNDVLAVMFFALFFGIGLMLVQTPQTQVLKTAIEGVFEVAMKLIGLVIQLAPIAIFCFMFNLAAQFGWDLIVRLSAYVGVVLLALGLQMFVIFPIILRTLAKKSPVAFFRETQEAFVMAFATASSNATLPTSLRVAHDQLRLPDRVARFVLTIGATANQNGTAMFEGVTVIFLAQFFGIDLTLTQQISVMLVCILGGIGTAGVPAGSLPVIALILASVGVPPEGIGLVLGVDRFLDMCRTVLNVIGDLVAATVVSAGVDDQPASSAASG